MAMKAVVNVGAGLLIIYLLSTFDMNGVSFIPILAVIAVLGGAIGMSYLTQGEFSYVDADDEDSETEEDEYIELKVNALGDDKDLVIISSDIVTKSPVENILISQSQKINSESKPSKKLSAFEQAEALRLRTDNKQGEVK